MSVCHQFLLILILTLCIMENTSAFLSLSLSLSLSESPSLFPRVSLAVCEFLHTIPYHKSIPSLQSKKKKTGERNSTRKVRQ